METDGPQLRSLLAGDSNGYHGSESSQPMRQEKKKGKKQRGERSYGMPSSGKDMAVALQTRSDWSPESTPGDEMPTFLFYWRDS